MNSNRASWIAITVFLFAAFSIITYYEWCHGQCAKRWMGRYRNDCQARCFRANHCPHADD